MCAIYVFSVGEIFAVLCNLFCNVCTVQCSDILCSIKCITVMWKCAELCSVEVCIVVQLAQVIPKNTQQCAVYSIVCRVVECAASAGYSLMFPISRIAPLCHSVNWTAQLCTQLLLPFYDFALL